MRLDWRRYATSREHPIIASKDRGGETRIWAGFLSAGLPGQTNR